ncbi:hypothetical protein OIHEL45_19766 [Sulfitobacter indolifex HEL-45]|uniref:Uncharacterized protein n=1 Tax=Sulfitobacter indolifex HEL-45 TaxID=391624 RepID=A0ABM9X0B3_9RHOB|nr:hypothetical protein OIHEL45_19766 [Sulfitobacter indolifex HEL-45]
MPFLQELAGRNWLNTFEPLDIGHWLILLTADRRSIGIAKMGL